MPRTVAVIQARMGSTRFPRKVLSDIAGQPLLQRVVRRVGAAKELDEVVIATTDSKKDDELAESSILDGLRVVRGSEDDVLARFIQAINETNADWVVRVNADNPFLAPEYIDELAHECRFSGTDYASYRVGQRPAMLTGAGLFTELISADCLRRAEATLQDSLSREHVTYGIYHSPDVFKVRFLTAPEFSTDSRFRLTLDTLEDLGVLEQVARAADVLDSLLSAERLCGLVAANEDWLCAMDRINKANAK